MGTSYLSEPNHSRRQAITLVTSKHRQYASRKNPPILLLRLPEQTRRRPLSCTPAIPRPQRSDRRVYPRLCRRSLHLDNQSHRPGRLLRCPHARCPCPTGPRATHEHRQERRQRDAINRKEPQSKHNTKSRGGQPEKGNVCTLLKDTEILERCIWDRRTGVWVTRGSQQGGK